jgi:hypothetical protein
VEDRSIQVYPMRIRDIAVFCRSALKVAWTRTCEFLAVGTVKAWLLKLVPPVIGFILLSQLSLLQEHEVTRWVFGIVAPFVAWGLLILLCQLIIAPVRMCSKLKSEIKEVSDALDAARSEMEPRLELTFDRGGSYMQLVGPHKLYRVGLRNLSRTISIESAFVEVTRIDPDPPPFLPFRLRKMHDREINHRFRDSFDLHPGEEAFVDVLFFGSGRPGEPMIPSFQYTVPDMPAWYVPSDNSRFRLVARGRNCPSVVAEFRIASGEEFQMERSAGSSDRSGS